MEATAVGNMQIKSVHTNHEFICKTKVMLIEQIEFCFFKLLCRPLVRFWMQGFFFECSIFILWYCYLSSSSGYFSHTVTHVKIVFFPYTFWCSCFPGCATYCTFAENGHNNMKFPPISPQRQVSTSHSLKMNRTSSALQRFYARVCSFIKRCSGYFVHPLYTGVCWTATHSALHEGSRF